MRTKLLLSAVMLAVCALPACGTDGGTWDAPDPAAPSTIEQTLLASVNVGYGRIDFIQEKLGDQPAVSIGEFASAYLRTTPLDALYKSGRFTTLEIFQAVAPDQPTPDVLVQLHPTEARQLGRATVEVRHAAFDRNAPVEKSSAACEAYAFQDETPGDCNNYVYKQARDYTAFTPDWLPVGKSINDWGYWTFDFVTMAVCNEGIFNMTGRIATSIANFNNNGWNIGAAVLIGPGMMWRQRPNPHSVFNPVRYAVQGSGREMLLRTAVDAWTCVPR